MSKAGPSDHAQLDVHPQPSLHSTIVDLRLNENKIRSVHYSSLSRFGNLTYLNLTKNDISYVEDGAFSAQFNLQVSADPGDANVWIFPDGKGIPPRVDVFEPLLPSNSPTNIYWLESKPGGFLFFF